MLASRIEELIDKDRFTCQRQKRKVSRVQDEVCRRAANEEQELQNRFRAQEIPELIFRKYFSGPKMRGIRDPSFIERINAQFICLVCSVIQHNLKAHRTGQYLEPLDFKQVNSSRKLIIPLLNEHCLNIANKAFLSDC